MARAAALVNLRLEIETWLPVMVKIGPDERFVASTVTVGGVLVGPASVSEFAESWGRLLEME